MAGGILKAGQFEGFFAVGSDQGKAGQVQMMDGFGINAQPDAALMTKVAKGIEERLGNDAFAIIADDHGLSGEDAGFGGGEQTARGWTIEVVTGFPVEADNLLLMGDNAGFNAGGPVSMREHATAIDVMLGEQVFEPFARFVATGDAKEFSGRAEDGKISGDVGSAPGHIDRKSTRLNS